MAYYRRKFQPYRRRYGLRSKRFRAYRRRRRWDSQGKLVSQYQDGYVIKRMPLMKPMVKVTLPWLWNAQYFTSATANTMNFGVSQACVANRPRNPFAGTGEPFPYMWDQWIGLYNKYCVVLSRITVSVLYQTGTYGITLEVHPDTIAQVAPGSSTLTPVVLLHPNAKYITTNRENGTNTPPSLSRVVAPNKYLLIENPLDNGDVNVENNVDPTSLVYWNIGVASNNPNDTVSHSVYLRLKLETTIVFSDPITTHSVY